MGKRGHTLGVGLGAIPVVEEGLVPVIETEDEGDPSPVAGHVLDPERGGPTPEVCLILVTGVDGQDPGTEEEVTGLVPVPKAETATASLL